MLEAVVNLSEGRHRPFIDAFAAAAGDDLLDVHADAHHNRSVLTLVGEEAPRRVAEAAIRRLDLRRHRGVHPRLGVVDVVPFVPIGPDTTLADACAARDRYAAWSPVPCVRYGIDEPTLPEIRRRHGDLAGAHPTAGITCVGARPVLVAYNVWLDESVRTARGLAAAVRSPSVRALGLSVGDGVQVSMNLVDPAVTGPAAVFDAIAGRARVVRAELVGLVPESVLDAVAPERWEQLDLSPARTIEARVAAVRR